jgi:signal transduction histidine kinase
LEANNPLDAPHFRISAAVVKQLGEELITDEVTAFMELVKNSYDADSSRVMIDINTIELCGNTNLLDISSVISETFGDIENRLVINENSNQIDDVGYISIKDNGGGMSKDDVINKWMTISLSEKRDSVKHGISTTKGRSYLGEKGVGRLSTQRLGSTIDLITGKVGDDFFTHLYFDWNAFNENRTLDEVKPGFKSFSKPVDESGTEIIIRNLKSKDVWEGDSYSKILGQLSQLISPKKNTPGGFKINIRKNNSIQDLLDINKAIDDSFVSSFSFALGSDTLTIDGIVGQKKLYGSSRANHENFEKFIAPDNGEDFFRFLTSKQHNKKESLSGVQYVGDAGQLFKWQLAIKINEIPELIYVEKRDFNDLLILDDSGMLIYELAHPGSFTGKINDYSFTKDFGHVLNTNADIKTIIQNQTGVRIYRDGFGIKPYGINSQDWLRLGAGNTSGSSFYGLKPFNIVGYVEIGAKDNYFLREKTDREGFIESPHSINFFKIMYFVVKQINLTLEKTRRSFNEYITHISADNVGIDPVQNTFDSLISTAKKSRGLQERMAAINYRLADSKKKIADIKFEDIDIAEDRNKLRKQLSLLNGLLVDSDQLMNEISLILEDTKTLDTHVSVLKPQIESLENQLMEFTDLASLGLTAEALSHELSNIADKLFEETNLIIKNYAKKIPKEFLKINIYLELVKSSVTSFRKQLSHLDPALKYVRESKEVFSINLFFVELEEFYQERFGDKIRINLKRSELDPQVKVNKGKLIQIIDNLVLNSEYWLKDKLKMVRTFNPEITIDISPPYIRIYDNGNGIPHHIEDTLFQPFVTLKPKGVGRGLGLFIVQQLLDSLGCSIILLPDRNPEGNRYVFQLYINSLIV